MPEIQWATNSYQSRARPLSAQQLVNLYAAAAPKDAKSPVVLHGSPGIKTFCDNLGDGPIRGMHVMDGLLYVISGCTLYSVDAQCNAFPIGSIYKGGAGEPGVCMGAVASFRITAGSAGAGNQITSIKINGDEILGTAVNWETSDAITASKVCRGIIDPVDFPPVYAGDFLDTTANNIFQGQIAFKPDGTILYAFGNDAIWQYNLSIPWRLASAVYSGAKFDVTGLISASNFSGMVFSPTGTHVLFVTENGDREVFELALSSAWDIGSASSTGVSQSLDNSFGGLDVTDSPYGLAWSGDGLSLFVIDQANDSIVELSVSGPFRLSGAADSGKAQVISGGNSALWGISFSADGKILYLVDEGANKLIVVPLATPYDPTTKTSETNHSISTWEKSVQTSAVGLAFSADFDFVFIADQDNSFVYRYEFPEIIFTAGAIGNQCNISAPAETADFYAGAVVEITTSGDVQVDNPTPPMGGGFCMPGNDC